MSRRSRPHAAHRPDRERTSHSLVELTARPVRVREAVLHLETWLSAWRHVTDLEVIAPGAPSGLDRRYRLTVRAVAPYRLTWQMHTVRADAGRITWCASGDLEGDGDVTLTPTAAGTLLTARWTARPMRRWMILTWPLAHRLFDRNHDAIMRRGIDVLATHLGADVLRCEIGSRRRGR